jgi:hypothetical protein
MVTEYSIRPVDPILPGTEFQGRPTPLVPRQIPWGYSRDRLTAVAVDPNLLFTYWELRDESIEAVRRQLGTAGHDAQLTIRVFDTSGRIFDGNNAHSFFDQDVHRTDRQWFCRVGKPASTAHVEMGLRTREGRFYRVARSGRVDFPRNSPAGGGPVEWMRVVPHSGVIASRETPAAPPPPPGAPPAVASVNASGDGLFESATAAGIETSGHFEVSQTTPLFTQQSAESWEWYERQAQHFELDSGWQLDPNDPNVSYRSVSLRWEELGLNNFRWETGPVESSWQAGPFSYPTEVIAPAVEHYEGPRVVMRSGPQVRVLHGPWQVVIRGINAHAEHRVLGRWEVHRSWLSLESRVAAGDPALAPGRGVGPAGPAGASERHLAASELRLRGSSEVFFMGASERRLGGASESRFLGASQLLQRGQSELRLSGQSELRLRGQSELRLGGASERRLAGQSELRMGGASEQRLGGASERRLGGASEQRGQSEQRLGSASERPPSLYPQPQNGKD